MIINIPINVPDEIEKMGGIMLYAMTYAGWTPKVWLEKEFPILDDDGKTKGFENRQVEVENPLTPLESGIEFKQKQLKDEFRSVLLQLGREAGEKQASQQFEALFQ